jgi:hypothetical protein
MNRTGESENRNIKKVVSFRLASIGFFFTQVNQKTNEMEQNYLIVRK